MIKEIEKKVKITQEIFHNIVKMMKSSNVEDFFIAVESWKNMNPTSRLDMLLYKAVVLDFARRELVKELNLPQTLTWEEVWEAFNVVSTTDLEKVIFNELYNKYVEQLIALNTNAKAIRSIKVELKWKT
tara:strand:+ start:831 stop:1217 length:387 start_codon:yes stop_codon:yes gene_type:complete